ncbi:MAG: hypothetical protein EOQ39_19010 [Mesorhizobium sp.]|uniref:hypothetical protein n=1 Tax=Mesorhizobium sp. TaxID=1871066 RepID=UPI000FE9DBCE|nr:hypothetical protein [Mesorhizobium sp.]RWB08737.1 MAG: hypothetical protein EOQ37_04325 [Mesorhizobium sp.]RWB13610.1 MAG: hypothetical protein EOQ39_19010 [Mesorhizobium sp.]
MMETGTKLATKDGRVIGNAIVLAQKAEDAWLIETDFGNVATLSASEIDAWFYVGPVTDLTRWLHDRELVRCVQMT